MDKPDPDAPAEPRALSQYPAADADGHDMAFYDANHRDTEIDNNMEQQHQPLDPEMGHHESHVQPAPNMEPEVEEEQSHAVNFEELQLAAQLSQGLAPMMEAAHAAAAAAAATAAAAAAGSEQNGLHDNVADLQAPQAEDTRFQDQEHMQSHPHMQGADHAHTQEHSHGQEEHGQEQLQAQPLVQDPEHMQAQQQHLQDQANLQGHQHLQDQNLHPSEHLHHADQHALQSHGPAQHQDVGLQHQQQQHHHHSPDMQHETHGLPGQDHDLHPQDQTLHAHDPNIHSHDQSIHTGFPQQNQPAHSYTEHAQQVVNQAQQVVNHIPHIPMAHMLAGAVDNTPPRKRSKVSRACDECRRKKVKCDAATETGDDTCSNCRRSQMQCMFSRVPQKRGPSKGYIKELADRINSIEGKLGGQAATDEMLALIGRRESGEPYTPLNENAKRPFSSMTRDMFSTPEAPRAWPSKPAYTPAALAPQPKPDGSVLARSESIPESVPAVSLVEQTREVEEDAFHAYLDIIHPALPFLAGSKAGIQADLNQCPPSLRDAFVEALSAAVSSFFPASPKHADTHAAHRSLVAWELEGNLHTSLSNRVHLQTLLLLAIEADNHGPQALKGQHGGPSKTSLLARAVAVAYAMDLRTLSADATLDGDANPESIQRVTLRAWWSLVALDRWNASGTGDPLLIPQDGVVLPAGLRHLMGEGAFQFIMLSYLLGPMVAIFFTSPRTSVLTAGTGAAYSKRNSPALEMWRMNLPDNITPASHPVVHLAYWHCRLLDYLLMPQALASDVAWAAKETITMLSSQKQLLSPFNHNFTCLASLCLAELARVEQTREEATLFLRNEIVEATIASSSWDAFIRDKIGESLRPSTAQNLQQLADLATATELSAAAAAAASVADKLEDASATSYAVENYEEMGFDPRPMLRAGYLNAVRPAA